MPLFLGLDTGTSGTKAIIIDEAGALRASATHEYPLSTPHPQWAEQDPDADWWSAAQKAILDVLARAGVSGDQVGAVGLTGQMHGSVFLDREGAVIRPALLWCDSRTGEQCRQITQAIGGEQRLFETIGQPILTSFTAPKILWLRQNEPQNYERVAKVLLPKDYIRFKLTGEFAAEVSDASGTSLLDVRRRDWSPAMLTALDIPRDWLPDVFESPEVTGTITPAAAALTGLRAGTPVVGGAGDQAAGAVGTGTVETGRVSSALGTSGVVFAHADGAFFDPQMRLQTFCHAVPGAWHMMGCVISAGGSLRWLRDTFYQPEGVVARTIGGDTYDLMTRGAATVPAGCEGLIYLPYLAGERTPYPDPDARGVFFGASLRSTRATFARAVLEGVAFAFKDGFSLVDEIGIPVAEVRASGGGAKSPFWLQIMADVIGHKHVLLHVDEGPAFGAALLAGVGTGAYASVAEACATTIRTTTETLPNPANAAVYTKTYGVYRSLYPALKDQFAAVSRLAASAADG
jgi:xylulokinase